MTTAADLEQRFIDGDTSVTRKQIEDAKAAEVADANWQQIEERADFWPAYVAAQERHLAGDPELAKAQQRVSKAVADLVGLVDRRLDERQGLVHGATRFAPYAPADFRPLLASDSRTRGVHPVATTHYAEVREAITAGLEIA